MLKYQIMFFVSIMLALIGGATLRNSILFGTILIILGLSVLGYKWYLESKDANCVEDEQDE